MGKTYRKFKGKIHQDKDRDKGVMHPDSSCLNHGGCPYCEGNRTYQHRKAEAMALSKMEDY